MTKVLVPRMPKPPDQVFEGGWPYKYLVNLLRGGKAEVRADKHYQALWSKGPGDVIPFLFDGHECALDFSDFLQLPDKAVREKYDPLFKVNYAACHEAWPNVHPFGPWTIQDWDGFLTVQQMDIEYDASGEIYYWDRAPLHRSRRRKAHELLMASEFGHVLRLGRKHPEHFVNYTTWLEGCIKSLAVLHVQGTWPHQAERTVTQCWAFGVCTLTHEIWIHCPTQIPEPWVHYVPVAVDLSDVVEKVRWCYTHREQCVEIGQNAKRFYDSFLSPAARFRHVKEIVDDTQNNRSSPAGAVHPESS